MNPQTEARLWGYAVATYGFGDVVTTAYGMELDAVNEAHPVSDEILGAAGVEGMVATKALVLFVAYAAYKAAPAEHRVGIPIGLALLGTAVVANNTAVIGQALDAGGSP